MFVPNQPKNVDRNAFATEVGSAVNLGNRFVALFATPSKEGIRLLAVLSGAGSLSAIACSIDAGGSYPALSTLIPAARWYEREIFDSLRLRAGGSPRPNAFPVSPTVNLSSPPEEPGGGDDGTQRQGGNNTSTFVTGEGLFKIPLGPVRSGIFEAIEYLVETPGEDILHVEPRPFYKHRGVEATFHGKSIEDGALLAERVEGVAGVAHATAYCEAIERLTETVVPVESQLVRVIHAELERVVNHLDSIIRHCEAAGQAVAYARFSMHKERYIRLRADLCGNRFSRGVLVPGGIRTPLMISSDDTFERLSNITNKMHSDQTLLMSTPSFLDRLRGTGVLDPEIAQAHGALGPIGRGSGLTEDIRRSRPYGGYQYLGFGPAKSQTEGDVLARQNVRIDEIASSLRLIRQALDELDELGPPSNGWRVDISMRDGESFGWAEAPQGEVVYLVVVENGQLKNVRLRSASFHNMALFSSAFPKDITTDFAFIEASFGLCVAGVSG